VRSLAGLKMLGMNPTALHVDPKIVAVDVKFRAQSEEAEQAFEEMEEVEIEAMHERFVKAGGGVVVTGEVVVTPKKIAERVTKENTLEETKRLLLQKKTIKEIATERDMVESTVWGHIEKLVELGQIDFGALVHLEPKGWEEAYGELREAIGLCGHEKLKPIFEYCKEKYDYNLVRLARVQFLLTT
jgi:hypothetical protein